MNEVLKKMLELESLLRDKVAHYDSLIEKANRGQVRISKLMKDLEAKKTELAEREKIIKEAEDLISLKKKLAEQGKSVKEAQAQLEINRRSFQEYCKAKNEEIAKREAEVKKDKELLAKEWAALREEQKNYKAKILEEIKNKVK